MKRYIKSSKSSKPTTISTNKLRSGVAIRDNVYLSQYSSVSELEEIDVDMRPWKDVNPYTYEGKLWQVARWATSHKISYNQLKTLHCNYIIDTLGHLHTAALSDNEDISLDTVHIGTAIQQVCEMLLDDLRQYDNDDSVVEVDATLDIYGYGNYKLRLRNNRNLIDSWGSNRNIPSKTVTYLATPDDHDPIYIDLADAAAYNSSFKRQQLRDIVAFLGEPLSKLK